MSDLRETIKGIQRAVGVDTDGVFGPVTAKRVLASLNKDIEQPDSGNTLVSNSAVLMLDGRSISTLAHVDPKAVEPFRKFLCLAKATAATMGCDYRAISGYRSWEEQADLYAKSQAGGPHAARPGYSWHNFGTAIDCGVFQADGKIYLDDGSAAQQQLAERVHAAVAAHAHECGLEWGGTWKGKSCDPPHFQIDMGSSSPTSAHRESYKAKGSVL